MPESVPFSCEPLPGDAVEVARLQGAWGVKGWVKLLLHSPDSSVLLEATRWHLTPPEVRYARGFDAFREPVAVVVRAAKFHADGAVAEFEGLSDRDQAEALKGARVWLPRSAFPPAAEGEYYWIDLIGCEVFNREGLALGLVRDLMPTGPHSVLCLEQTLEGKVHERMVPFVSVYVDKVDVKARRIDVDWQPDY